MNEIQQVKDCTMRHVCKYVAELEARIRELEAEIDFAERYGESAK